MFEVRLESLGVLIVLFAIVFAFPRSSVEAQTQSPSRAEQLEDLYDLPEPGPQEGVKGDEVPRTEPDEGPGDMGEIQILRRKKPHKYYEIYASESTSFPDNAFLTRRARSDLFLQTRVGARYHPKHPYLKHFTFDANANLYRYKDFESLDFNSFRLTARYNRPVTLRGVQFAVFGRSGYSRLEYATSQGTANRGSAFLKQFFLKAGVQKVYPLSRSQFLSGGLSVRATSSDFVDGLGTRTIDDPERDSWSAFLGYNHRYSRRIGFRAVYRVTNSRYQFIRVPNVHRRDRTHTLSGSVTYRMYKFLELNLTYNYANNNSNATAFEYEVNTFGAGGSLSWRF